MLFISNKYRKLVLRNVHETRLIHLRWFVRVCWMHDTNGAVPGGLVFYFFVYLCIIMTYFNLPYWRCKGLLFNLVTLNDTHTHTLGRTPLDEGSARRRDLYLTTHNTQKRETSMTPAGFEPAIPANKRSQTQALDRAATVIGRLVLTVHQQGEASSMCSITRIPPLPYTQTSKFLALLYVSLGLTLKNSIFCTRLVFTCFVWISEQTASVSLHWLLFIIETVCVLCTHEMNPIYNSGTLRT